MGALATAALVVLAISLLTFVVFFGRLPMFRHTPVAWLHRFFVARLPGAVLAADQRLTGGRLTASLRRLGHAAMHDRHPTVLLFYLALLAGSEGLALPEAWPQLGTGVRVALAVLVVLPYGFLYLAAATDPGTVSLASLPQHLHRYPYDYALFYPGARCATCRLLKPPRSKHCGVCKRCVGRLDHHCIFINNCVGVGNHHWFLLLLLSTALLASVGGLVGLRLIADRVRAEQLAGFSLVPWWTRIGDGQGTVGGGAPGARMPFSFWMLYLTWGMRVMIRLGCVSLLALLLSPLVWGLLAYNVWNVHAGQTTNESLKWSDWKADMADGYVYRRRLSSSGGWQTGVVPQTDDDDTTADTPPPAAATPWTRWPVEAQHVLVRTDDGKPPTGADAAGLPGVGAWEPVWTLRDVENLYDLGFWNNLVDVFNPDHDFRPRGLPSVEPRGRPRARVVRTL